MAKFMFTALMVIFGILFTGSYLVKSQVSFSTDELEGWQARCCYKVTGFDSKGF
jgi:hypothetical protein